MFKALLKVCHVLKTRKPATNKVFWMRINKSNVGVCEKSDAKAVKMCF